MSTDPFVATGGWAEGREAGSLQSWAFEGAEGLARLDGPARFSAEPERFAAALTRVQLDHVAIESFSATPHRAERAPAQIAAHPLRLLTFLLVVDGGLRVSLAGDGFVLHAGECVVVDSDDCFAYESSGPVRLLRAVVGMEHVPEDLWRAGATIPWVLQRTALVECFVAFIGEILRVGGRTRGTSSEQLIRSVAELVSAVLVEARRSDGHRLGSAALRCRIEDYIEGHYTDADLTVTRLAHALGVSVGHAHAVFTASDRTIARSIQSRRVSSVAESLRRQAVLPSYARLAGEHGFGSVDTLRRAFRHEHGMSLSAYRAASHRSMG